MRGIIGMASNAADMGALENGDGRVTVTRNQRLDQLYALQTSDPRRYKSEEVQSELKRLVGECSQTSWTRWHPMIFLHQRGSAARPAAFQFFPHPTLQTVFARPWASVGSWAAHPTPEHRKEPS